MSCSICCNKFEIRIWQYSSIEQAKFQSDKVVSVAVHLYSNNDVYNFEGSTLLNEEFEVGGLPEGRLNRINIWTPIQQENLDEVLDLTGFSPIGIAMNSQVNGNLLNTEINIKFIETFELPLKLVLYLVENDLIHDQTNYTENLFSDGFEDPLVDFVHNDVLRAIYTDYLGNTIPSTEPLAKNIYTVDLQNEIPNTVENNTNLHLVAFVVNATTKEVINVREIAVVNRKIFKKINLYLLTIAS